jgi:hypothetical protein
MPLPPTCSIQYRPDLDILVVRWPDDAPFEQLQADFEAVLKTANEYQAPCWMLDVRRRDDLAPELAHWTTEIFFPLAAAQLSPQVLRLGVLCSPARLAVYDANPDQKHTLAFGLAPERPYRMRLFADEAATVNWLRS